MIITFARGILTGNMPEYESVAETTTLIYRDQVLKQSLKLTFYIQSDKMQVEVPPSYIWEAVFILYFVLFNNIQEKFFSFR